MCVARRPGRATWRRSARAAKNARPMGSRARPWSAGPRGAPATGPTPARGARWRAPPISINPRARCAGRQRRDLVTTARSATARATPVRQIASRPPRSSVARRTECATSPSAARARASPARQTATRPLRRSAVARTLAAATSLRAALARALRARPISASQMARTAGCSTLIRISCAVQGPASAPVSTTSCHREVHRLVSRLTPIDVAPW